GADFATCIENIDIGGPAMIRAAAKNHADVTVVVDPHDYALVLAELRENGGATTFALRRKLAAKAYARTAVYDAAISNWFADQLSDPAPAFRAIGGRLVEALRYGENPHQSAAFYRTSDLRPGVATARQVQGKKLSYNNINDTDAAYECVAEFDPNARRPASSSSTPIRAAPPRARASSTPIARRWPAIRCRPSAESWRWTPSSTAEPRAASPISSPRGAYSPMRAAEQQPMSGARRDLLLPPADAP